MGDASGEASKEHGGGADEARAGDTELLRNWLLFSLWGLAAVVVIVAASPLEMAAVGQFGDLTAVFGIAALLYAIRSVNIQRHGFEKQCEELRLQREQSEKLVEEHERQRGARREHELRIAYGDWFAATLNEGVAAQTLLQVAENLPSDVRPASVSHDAADAELRRTEMRLRLLETDDKQRDMVAEVTRTKPAPSASGGAAEHASAWDAHEGLVELSLCQTRQYLRGLREGD